MTNAERDDIDRWSETWQESAPCPAEDAGRIVAEVRRRTRRRALVVAMEGLVLVAGLTVLGGLGLTSVRVADRLFAGPMALVLLAFGAAWVRNLRGTWAPPSSSVQDFIALEIRRAARVRAAVRAGWVLLVAMVLAYGPWITWRFADPAVRGRAFTLLAALVGAEVGVLVLLARRGRRQSARWRSLGDEWARSEEGD